MPNHILNKVTFLGKKENVDRAVEALGPKFDLNNVEKEPEGLVDEVRYYAVEAAKEYFEKHADEDPEAYAEKKFATWANDPEDMKADFLKCVESKKKYGYLWWMEWRMKNWGTKWNTYDHGDEFGVFLTANKTCAEAYRRISEKFGITVKAVYADEDMGYNCGIITAKNGVLTKWNPEPGSEEAERFAESVWNS